MKLRNIPIINYRRTGVISYRFYKDLEQPKVLAKPHINVTTRLLEHCLLFKNFQERKKHNININNYIISHESSFEDLQEIEYSDPEITPEYIKNYFDSGEANSGIIEEYLCDINIKKEILQSVKKEIMDFYNAINVEKIDIDFIQKDFVSMFNFEYKYSDQITGQKFRLRNLIFQQAFKKNPFKFESLEQLIPGNLGCSVMLSSQNEVQVICHSVCETVTAKSLQFGYEIVCARMYSGLTGNPVFLKCDKDDFDPEVKAMLEGYIQLNDSPQKNADAVIFVKDENGHTYIRQIDFKFQSLSQVYKKVGKSNIVFSALCDLEKVQLYRQRYVDACVHKLNIEYNYIKTTNERKAQLIKFKDYLIKYRDTGEIINIIEINNDDLFSFFKFILPRISLN